jgi:hypothetical protein
METLREVQEPVAKSTYAEKLPGYSKDGPRNNYEIGGVAANCDADEFVPEDSLESLRRSKLPWSFLTVGSFFMVLLWLIALTQTVIIPLGPDTGIGATNRRLLSTLSPIHELVSVRGLIGDTILADEWNLFDFVNGGKLPCLLPKGTVIQALAGSPQRPYVLSRTTSGIWDCAAGKFLRTPVDKEKIYSIAVVSDDVFALKSDGIYFLAADLMEPQWVLLPSTVAVYHNGCSLGINEKEDLLVILDPKSQLVKRFDISSGNFDDTLDLKNLQIHWTHTSGDAFVGFLKSSRGSRIVSFL